MRYRDGVIVGRFYPYHHGHRAMIRHAMKHCDRVHVIVCGRDQQTIPAERRAEWIQNDLPVIAYPFDQDRSGVPDRSAELWARKIEEIVGFSPDALFTSEPYQAECAELMGAELELYDPDRNHISISATQIRENPAAFRNMVTNEVCTDIQAGLADDQKCRMQATSAALPGCTRALLK